MAYMTVISGKTLKYLKFVSFFLHSIFVIVKVDERQFKAVKTVIKESNIARWSPTS